MLSFLPKLLSSSYTLLLFICSFNLVYFFAEHEGLYFYDDYSYSLYAYKLSINSFVFEGTPFCHRFLVFLPTAIFYMLFGVNPYSTTFWPLICTLGFYLSIWLTFRKQFPVATASMLVLSGLYYFLLNTINYLYPDNIALFFNTAISLVLYQVRGQLPVTKATLLGILFSFLNLLNFLTKETLLYTVPFYIILFIHQCYGHKNIWFWITAGLSSFIILISYLGLYELYTGDMFLRIHDIEAYSQILKAKYLADFSHAIVARLTYEPFLFLISSGLAIPLVFATTVIFTPQKFRLTNLQDPISFWIIALLTMLISIWFGSVSLDHYKPITLLPRMFHPLLPPLCIVGGLAIVQTWHRRVTHFFLAAVFLSCTLLAPINMKIMYAPFTLFFGLNYLLQIKFSINSALVVCAMILSIRPVYFIWKPTVSNYFEQYQIIQKHLRHKEGTYVVVTDWVLARTNPFAYSFSPPSNYLFIPFDHTEDVSTLQADTVYLLINNGTLKNPEHNISIREKDILPRYTGAQLLMQQGQAKLFALPKL